MKFSIQLSADYPRKDYGGDRVYQDMLDQAVLADRLGFDAVSITEHHLMNCLIYKKHIQELMVIRKEIKSLLSQLKKLRLSIDVFRLLLTDPTAARGATISF